jgi:hypothetical protein
LACRASRVEKVKCDKCDELEATLDSEKKSNVQLKKQIELKDTNKKQPTTNAGPCSKCPTSQELLDQQKEKNIETMDHVMTQEKKTQEERAGKEVSIERIFLVERLFHLVGRTNPRHGSISVG